MNEAGLLDAVSRVIHAEGLALDRQRWDDWLALYAPEAVFWMPAWKGEHELCDDPERELSLIYYANRQGLEERVSRVRSGKSIASTPLPRTTHCIAGVVVEHVHHDGVVDAAASWTVHQYAPRLRTEVTLHGLYEHRMAFTDGAWRILRKKVTLRSECIPTLLDFYGV
jgi:3-phenylpropionate/cinnamic acid dioxygenase small subunit